MALVSGDMVGEEFKRGWALRLGDTFSHFWIRRPNADAAVRACNKKRVVRVRLNNGQTGLFFAGDFPDCARCARAVA